MRIVITGALGHIGSYLIRNLQNNFKNLEIIMIDNLITQRYCSLFDLPSEVKFTFMEQDVSTHQLESVFSNANVVIHLAAITDATKSFENAELLERNNLTATRMVAECCAKTNTRLIALSSTSVYGTQKSLVSESCDLSELQPQSPYAETKIKEEQLVQELSQTKNLNAVIFRFGTIFGVSKGMRFHTAVNKFCWQAAMGLPITIWRTAYDQKRPYLDLKDALNAIVLVIKNDIFDGEVYNVLTSNLTVRDITETIEEFIPNLQLSFVDNAIMNQLSYEVSASKIESKGFRAIGSLRGAVQETIALLR